jgi:glycosyltransferase involved in cell wall biosynthesis
MARLFMRLLTGLGYRPEIASSLRTHDPVGDEAVQRSLASAALREAERLVAEYSGRPAAERPALWFSYHVYYKAPDMIGPPVARALAIPYVVAEGSRAPKRRAGRWVMGHREAEAALDAASLILILNPNDRPMLEAGRPPGQHLVSLPPFIDSALWPLAGRDRQATGGGPVRLITVAMMRDGDKLASYRLLSEALAASPLPVWQLRIVGDGPARPAVEALFARFGERVRFEGAVEDRQRLGEFYLDADLLAWPAVNEAFGMVFLEAAAHGCPSVAGDFGGVRCVVRDHETGLLARPGDPASFAAMVARLCADAEMRVRLGCGARALAAREGSIEAAMSLCRPALAGLLAPSGAAA